MKTSTLRSPTPCGPSSRITEGGTNGTVVAVIVIGNVLYGAVFAPHLVTKLNG
jgi:hypothetical protein